MRRKENLMERIAIVISAPSGPVAQIAERIRRRLRGAYAEVQIFQVVSKADLAAISLEGYDGVLVGGTLEKDEFAPLLAKWAKLNSMKLNTRPFALFAVGPKAAPITTGGRPSDEKIIRHLLEKEGLRPQVTVGFAAQAPARNDKKAVRPAMDEASSIDWEAVMQFIDAFENASLHPLPVMESSYARQERRGFFGVRWHGA